MDLYVDDFGQGFNGVAASHDLAANEQFLFVPQSLLFGKWNQKDSAILNQLIEKDTFSKL